MSLQPSWSCIFLSSYLNCDFCWRCIALMNNQSPLYCFEFKGIFLYLCQIIFYLAFVLYSSCLKYSPLQFYISMQTCLFLLANFSETRDNSRKKIWRYVFNLVLRVFFEMIYSYFSQSGCGYIWPFLIATLVFNIQSDHWGVIGIGPHERSYFVQYQSFE